MGEYITLPNFWMAHCYHCKHLEFTEEWKVCYPWEVGLGNASHSQGSFLKWPGNAKCKLGHEIEINALRCEDHERKDGYTHWSYHSKYRKN
jgi:hypothetical protein